MVCIVLAAGYATRLYPLTENFPKPLLKVKEKTILDWLLDDIDKQKVIDDYVIISNDKYYSHFKDWQKEKKLSAPVTVINDGSTNNENRLGAVMDILFAVEKLNIDDDCFIIAGDNVLDFSFSVFLNYFNKFKKSCIMYYVENDIDRLKKCGTAKIAENGLVELMLEKSAVPVSNNCIPPFYIYNKDNVKLIKKAIENGCNVDAPGSLVSWLCSVTEIFAVNMPGSRYDIGDIKSYENVQRIYNPVDIL